MSEKVEKLNVRQLISKYESLDNGSNINSSLSQRHRTKSLGNILGAYPAAKPNLYKTSSTLSLVQIDKENLATLDDIEKALIRLETHLNYYETYNKERHIQFQNQLFDIFGHILTFGEERGGKKAELKETVQQLFGQLNDVLPVNYLSPGGAGGKKIDPVVNPAKIQNPPKFASKPEAEIKRKRVNSDLLNKFENLQLKAVVDSPKYEKSQPEIKPETQPEVQQETEVKPEANGFTLMSVTKLRSLFEEKNRENSKGLENIASMQNGVLPVKADATPEVVHQTNLSRKWNQMTSSPYSDEMDEEKSLNNFYNVGNGGYLKPEGSMEGEEGSGGEYTDDGDDEEVNENSLPRIMEENLWAKKYENGDEEEEDATKIDEDFDRIYQREVDHLDSDSLEG